ncbi:hypothetical protein K2X33_07100, partial [bacterium]|nr:hypothetical protein [bacterium]
VEYMYRPGIPWDEFWLTHYHYLTIPVCLLALLHLPRKRTRAVAWVAVLNPLIFGVSYFVFPASENVNCIHSACLQGSSAWTGPVYSLAFWAVIFAGNLSVAWGLERYFSKGRVTAKRRLRAQAAFRNVLGVVAGLCVWDGVYKAGLPDLLCDAPTVTASTRIGCAYTLDSSPGKLSFVYELQNKTAQPLHCTTYARTGYTQILLDDSVPVAAGKSLTLGHILPYPDVTVHVRLEADCTPANRKTATEN